MRSIIHAEGVRYAIVAQSDIKDAMLKLEAQDTATPAPAQAAMEAEALVN